MILRWVLSDSFLTFSKQIVDFRPKEVLNTSITGHIEIYSLNEYNVLTKLLFNH